MSGAPALALVAALVWGVLSVALSPCHLAGIPLIVGFVAGQPDQSPRKAFLTSGTFAVGILVTIGAIGVATSAAGRMLGDLGPWATYGVAVVLVVVGLSLAGVFDLPIPGLGSVPVRGKGLVFAFVLGSVFGLALGPCTFAFMVPVLGLALRVSHQAPIYAALLILAYGLGHCTVIAGVGGSIGSAQRLLDWHRNSNTGLNLRRVCGAVAVCGGLYLVWMA